MPYIYQQIQNKSGIYFFMENPNLYLLDTLLKITVSATTFSNILVLTFDFARLLVETLLFYFQLYFYYKPTFALVTHPVKVYIDELFTLNVYTGIL